MHNFMHEMLHGSPAALRIEALWKVGGVVHDRVTLNFIRNPGVRRGRDA